MWRPSDRSEFISDGSEFIDEEDCKLQIDHCKLQIEGSLHPGRGPLASTTLMCSNAVSIPNRAAKSSWLQFAIINLQFAIVLRMQQCTPIKQVCHSRPSWKRKRGDARASPRRVLN